VPATGGMTAAAAVAAAGAGDGAAEAAGKFCSIDNPECEACQ